MTSPDQIPGYELGSSQSAPSPLADGDLTALWQTLLWTCDDEAALRQAGEVLSDQVEDLLDVWYGLVASLPQLVGTFFGPRRSAGQ